MTNPETPSIPAGWHPDPAGTPRIRWWDGQQWTEHYAEQPVAAPVAPTVPAVPAAVIPPVPTVPQAPAAVYGATAPAASAAPYAATQPLSAPAGVQIYSTWVWIMVGIMVLLPILTLTVLNGNFIGSVTGSAVASDSIIVSTITNLVSILAYGAAVFLAFLDHRDLTRAGVQKPFHWAFTFIGTSVYLIGRGVVMKRRTGKGMLTAWIAIAVVALSIIAVIVIIIALVVMVVSTLS